MFKNDFFRFFAFGFAAGALVIGGAIAHAHDVAAETAPAHAAPAR